jgi:hypothetical protein
LILGDTNSSKFIIIRVLLFFNCVTVIGNQLKWFIVEIIGSGAPSSNDPEFKRRPLGAPWPTFHKSKDAKLFPISI